MNGDEIRRLIRHSPAFDEIREYLTQRLCEIMSAEAVATICLG